MTDRAGLVAGDEPYVVPGNAERSPLYQRMLDSDPNPMPQGAPAAERARQRTIIRDWINSGFNFPGARTEGPNLSQRRIINDIHAHLSGKAEGIRRNYRYFVFPLFGALRTTEVDMVFQKAALLKVINSMSWKREMMTLERVGTSGAIFAIDVSALQGSYTTYAGRGSWGWDTFTRDVEGTQTYLDWIVVYRRTTDAGLLAKAQEISRWLRIHPLKQPLFLRADWFVLEASKNSTYVNLLALPRRLEILEESFGINPITSFYENKVLRTGRLPTTSDVSAHNRIVDCYPLRHWAGEYWKSFDFVNSTPNSQRDTRSNPFEQLHQIRLDGYYGYAWSWNPTRIIEPVWDAIWAVRGKVFAEDGGEMIFSLPNGLQAYYITQNNVRETRVSFYHRYWRPATGGGYAWREVAVEHGINNFRLVTDRVFANSAPATVARDAGSLLGDTNIYNGVSCMACHKQGMITYDDNIGPDAIARMPLGPLRTKAAALYRSAELPAALRNSKNRFVSALQSALTGLGVDASVDEPIRPTYVAYNASLTADDLAGEVGVSKRDLRKFISRIRRAFGAGSPSAQLIERLCAEPVANPTTPAESEAGRIPRQSLTSGIGTRVGQLLLRYQLSGEADGEEPCTP